ncbi:MAG: hypothetical protein AAF483_02125 [Planctomycetota bacterium]
MSSQQITNRLALRRWAPLLLFASCIFSTLAKTPAQDSVKIWEYSPYEVEIWYAFQPEVNISDIARQQFISDLTHELNRTYRAAWRIQTSELAPEWSGIARRNFEEFTTNDLTENELTLAVAIKHESCKTIRTLEAAVEKLDEILVTESGMARLLRAASRFEIEKGSATEQLLAKCKVQEGMDLEQIKEKLANAEIPCAMLPRSELLPMLEKVRMLLTTIPWHTDNILKSKDKVIFLSIGQEGDRFTIQARELDCPMQFLGATFSASTFYWPHASRNASHCVVKAFAPIARVEEADALSATLLHRAGGLIVRNENPAKLKVGDVMQPIVRRDGKNGVPTLLQPIAWTFAVLTPPVPDEDEEKESENAAGNATDAETDAAEVDAPAEATPSNFSVATDGSEEEPLDPTDAGIKMNANVYTYSNGPGLQGRRNRRTQRILLRVRPTVGETDIKAVIRNTLKPQAGSFIYQRDLLTGEFEELGRTDWRGRFTVKVPEKNGKFLEARERKRRLFAKRDAQQAANIAKKDLDDVPEDISPEDLKAKQQAVKDTEAALAVFDEYDPESDLDSIPLNYPLIEIYIKNGNKALAKLPMVPGLKPIEVAEVADDQRRLQAEAFIRGFQGDITAVIGLRNVMAARIKMHLTDNRLDDATQSLVRMREIPTYDQLNDELDSIQRVMLDEKRGPIGISQKREIDGMFQITSDMLQSYLQDSLFQQSLKAVEDAGGDTVGPKKRNMIGN